jgi:hypothetical protein
MRNVSKLQWLLLAAALALVLTLTYAVAGPYLALNGIRRLVAAGQIDQLWRFVDFDALRSNLRPQLQQKMIADVLRHTGDSHDPISIGKASQLLTQPVLDAMSSPRGLAMLLQGSSLARTTPPGTPNDPLRQAQTRFESTSLFTATVPNAEQQPVVFELRRQGLSWKLTGIRLPD